MNTPEQSKPTKSLTHRYIKKLISNVVSLISGFILTSLVPKTLGPLAYGQYSYVVDLFNQFFIFLESGSSNALYNKISHKKENLKLIKIYLLFVLAINCIIATTYILANILNLNHYIFTDLKFNLIFLGFMMASFSWLQTVLVKILDGLGLTSEMETQRIVFSILKAAAIILLFTLSMLNLYSFFVFQIISTVILNISFSYSIYKVYQHLHTQNLTTSDIKENRTYFWQYSHPLFTYTLVGALAIIADRWLIQTYSGLKEQGYFALASQIALVCFIFSSSMIPLFHREIAITWNEKNNSRSIHMIETSFSFLYLVAAFLSVFFAANADSIVYLLAGAEFQGQTLAYALMFLFPIHQTYGQLIGSIYYATDKTKSYRNLGTIVLILGIVLSYLALNPSTAVLLGFNGGFESLAIKTVVVQFVSVNLLLHFALKHFNLKIWRFLRSQVVIILITGIAAYTARHTVILYITDSHTITYLITNGIIYLTSFMIYFWLATKAKIPLFIGHNNAEIIFLKKKLQQKYKNVKLFK